MGVLDFLWQGSPPPATTTYGTATTGIPQFLSDYTQGLLSKANAIAAEPFQAYTGPRIAQFTEAQKQAFDQTKAMQGGWSDELGSAKGYTQSAAAQNPFQASDPYMRSAMGVNPLGEAGEFVDRAGGVNPFSYSGGAFGAALGMNASGAASPYIQGAAGINPFMAAQPYTAGAAQTFTGSNVGNYMNPYIENVTNRIGELAGRNLREQLMPAIGDQFIKAGQYGSSTMQQTVGRALRDVQESALAQQNQALAQGYQTAGQLFGQDANRLAQLAGQQGQLGVSTMGQLGQLGATTGSLANQQMANYANIGNALGNQALNYQQNLGQLGSTMGNVAAQQMGQYGNLAQLAGNMSTNYANSLLRAGGQMGQLGQMEQTMALRDAAALEAVGQTQQAQDQRNLDLAYGDFLEQRNYPQQQAGFLSNMLRGVPYGTSTTTTQTGPASSYQPSPLSQVAGAAALTSALGNLKFAEGGEVKKKRDPNRRSSRGRKRR